MAEARSTRLTFGAGLVFVAAMAALSAYDIVRGEREATAEIGRDLHGHARVAAEQAARSLQAVDLVLRNVVAESRSGQLWRMSPPQLHAYLRNQALGLVQADGLAVFDERGTLHASSVQALAQSPPPSVAGHPELERLRAASRPTLVVADAQPGALVPDQWFLPIARRLERPDGRFAGAVAASVRIEYFQAFYREIQPEPGTVVAIVHDDGTLVARHPPAPAALGKPAPDPGPLQTVGDDRTLGVAPARHPIDGREQFGVRAPVPGVPLSIVITRDAATALAPWRERTTGTVARTGALVVVALALLALLRRQLRRLASTRASLELSRERFALAAAGSEEGIWDWNLKSGEVYGSPRAREIFGLAPGPERVGLSQWLAQVQVHPDDDETRRADLEAHLLGRTPVYACEYRVRTGDGAWRWVRVRGLCERDAQGQPSRMAGSVTDIDAHRRAIDDLRLSDERYALAMTGLTGGHWVWDVPSDALFVSGSVDRLFGLPGGHGALTRREYFAQVKVHPEDRAKLERVDADVTSGRASRIDHEYRIVVPDSAQPRWILTRARSFPGPDGRPLRVAGVSVDVTERKHADAERERLETQLRQAQKLEAIGTLAGGIAHDFNNILAAILGYGEMALKDAREGSAQRHHLEASISAGLRAKSLVERILAFSRGGVGERVPVHVQSVVQEALDQVQATMPAGIRLERRLDAGDAAVLGDPTQVHQVVMNLCANAAQAMRSHGTLEVVLDRVTGIAPGCTTCNLPEASYVRLIVRDDGAGIAPHVLERIFEPFFTTKGVGVGTGLGLSLVHGIVTDLGGGIDVRSEVGVGSTFTVYLPWQSCVAPQVREPVPALVGHGETVMLVDDEETLVRLGEELIAELGFEPLGYTSSRAALAAFRADPTRFDAVLSDEAMPELTGSELAREIRALRDDIPIVLVSGYVTPALTQRAREAGVAEVLAKPLVGRDIARALATALNRVERADVADGARHA